MWQKWWMMTLASNAKVRSCIRSWKPQWSPSSICFLSTADSLKSWSSLWKADPEATGLCFCTYSWGRAPANRCGDCREWRRKEAAPSRAVVLSGSRLWGTGVLLDFTDASGGAIGRPLRIVWWRTQAGGIAHQSWHFGGACAGQDPTGLLGRVDKLLVQLRRDVDHWPRSQGRSQRWAKGCEMVWGGDERCQDLGLRLGASSRRKQV